MDLTSLAVSQTATLILKHPVTGADMDVEIELHGKDSTKYRKEYTKLVAILSKDIGKGEVDYAKLDADTYAACTVSWKNLGYKGVKDFKCTPENVLTLYNDPDMRWLHEQVVQFVGDRANFMQPS